MRTSTASPGPVAPRFARFGGAYGVGLVLVSAAGFGALGVLAQLAYHAGVSVLGLLCGRFVVAASVLWIVVAAARRPLPSRRGLLVGAAVGAGYSSMALCFAASLRHIEAGLADLLLFAYPVLVALGAVALGRERWSRRQAAALAASVAGIALALTGPGAGLIDPLGVALALAAALIYAAYVLACGSLLTGTDPLVLAALIATGAGSVFAADATVSGQLAPRGGLTGIALVIAVALSCSVLGTAAFMTGVRKLGPSRASIVSSAEPALTATFAFAALGQTFGLVQLLGAGLVLASVPILELRARSTSRDKQREHHPCPTTPPAKARATIRITDRSRAHSAPTHTHHTSTRTAPRWHHAGQPKTTADCGGRGRSNRATDAKDAS